MSFCSCLLYLNHDIAEKKTVCERESIEGSSVQQTRFQFTRFVPLCDGFGAYRKVQCGSLGECWCVDRYGNELPRTKTKGLPYCGVDGKDFLIFLLPSYYVICLSSMHIDQYDCLPFLFHSSSRSQLLSERKTFCSGLVWVSCTGSVSSPVHLRW